MDTALLQYGAVGALAIAAITAVGALWQLVKRFINFLEKKDEQHVEERTEWLAGLEKISHQVGRQTESLDEMLIVLRRMNGRE